ncbi:hypothetical protein INR99_07635 [Chitinilyticum litopenaei]|uniref:ABC transporter permease n=1 Tax=Chitinilyticum piscinae TaxID=2866724 RepID=A0A8J7K1X1_9NEIS|nr:hypothetical protein [Chitinilyticum piscinae]
MVVALDIGISAIKLVATLLGLFWVLEMVAKDIDRKNLLWVLAYPAPRATYIVGRFIGIGTLLGCSIAFLGGLLWIVVQNSSMGYQHFHTFDLGSPYAITLAYLWLDTLIITAFTLLITTVSTSSLMPVFMGAAFAVSARSLGGVLAYLNSGESQINTSLASSVQKLQWILPDLSRLDLRDWPLYRATISADQLQASLTMSVSYIVIMLLLCCLSLSKRDIH